jgi:hypothetical protein
MVEGKDGIDMRQDNVITTAASKAVPVQAIRVYRGSGGRDPLIQNGTRHR